MSGKKKQPTVGDYVEVVREQASGYAPQGAEAGAGRRRGGRRGGTELRPQRAEGGLPRPLPSEPSRGSSPIWQEARRRAQPYVDTAAPRVQRAVEGLEPQVDKAHDVIVSAWIPRISAAIAALAGATVAAKDQVVEVSERAPDAVAVLKGDKVAKQPRGGKVLMGLGIVAAVGAVVVVLANRKPKDDPWATPSTSYTPPAKTFADRVSEAKDGVAAAAGTAAHKVSDVAETAAHKAGEVAEKAKETAGGATEKAKETAGGAADKAKTATRRTSTRRLQGGRGRQGHRRGDRRRAR